MNSANSHIQPQLLASAVLSALVFWGSALATDNYNLQEGDRINQSSKYEAEFEAGYWGNAAEDEDTLAREGVFVDALTGDISYFKDGGEIDDDADSDLLDGFEFSVPIELLQHGVDLNAFFDGNFKPDEIENGFLGGSEKSSSLPICIESSVVCAGGGVLLTASCAGALWASAVSWGTAAPVAIPTACVAPAAMTGAACTAAIAACTSFAETRHQPHQRHRTRHLAYAGDTTYDYFDVGLSCPNNFHLMRRMDWRVTNGRVSRIGIGCTDRTGINGHIGPTGGTGYGFTCGAGRMISRVQVKVHNGHIRALRPYCGNMNGARNWATVTGSGPTNAWNSAQGTIHNRQCADNGPTSTQLNHSGGAIRVIRNDVWNTLDAIRLTCH